MLGPPPTGLKRYATVPTLPRPHHTHPPAQRVRSSANSGRLLRDHPGHSAILACILEADVEG